MLPGSVGLTARRIVSVSALCLATVGAWAASATALELKPQNLLPPVISGTPVVGQPLGCSQGAWVGPPSAYAYQWTRAGTDLPGATLASYTVMPSDVGKALRCRVTASNSAGSAQAASAPVVGLGMSSSPDPPPSSSPGPMPRPEPAALIRLPPNTRCLTTRRIRIRIRKVRGIRVGAVAVYVNGKAVKVYRGKRSTRRIELRGLPRGTVRVRIVAATMDGRLIRESRRYHICPEHHGPKHKRSR
jgi:hypothetical protein